MEMKANPNNVLMSDVLKGQVPELENELPIDQVHGKHVVVIAQRTIGDRTDGMVGILRGLLLGESPEIEFRCEIKEALEVMQANSLSFSKFELHHGVDTVVPIPGPFIVKAARIDEISAQDQVCTLGLHLQRQAR